MTAWFCKKQTNTYTFVATVNGRFCRLGYLLNIQWRYLLNTGLITCRHFIIVPASSNSKSSLLHKLWSHIT